MGYDFVPAAIDSYGLVKSWRRPQSIRRQGRDRVISVDREQTPSRNFLAHAGFEQIGDVILARIADWRKKSWIVSLQSHHPVWAVPQSDRSWPWEMHFSSERVDELICSMGIAIIQPHYLQVRCHAHFDRLSDFELREASADRSFSLVLQRIRKTTARRRCRRRHEWNTQTAIAASST